jgi:hypothetical protein
MNIYEFQTNGEKDWICADTLIEAFQHYNSLNDWEINDFAPTDDIIIIPEEEWENYTIVDEENNDENGSNKTVTFTEYMIGNIDIELIASTAN